MGKCIVFLLAGLLAAAATAADPSGVVPTSQRVGTKTEPLPYGHPDPAPEASASARTAADKSPPYGAEGFRPSGERPIGFMGDGTGCYPGARPPTEFRDGTPADVEEPNPPHSPVRVQVLTDAKSKNILWKTEMPSWANTQPVVVGDQVFTTAEPNLLVAVDALTGVVRWTQEANAWEIAGVEPALAKKLQEMWHIANDGIPQFWAMTGRGTVCWEMPPEKLAPILAIYREKVQPRILAALKELDPDGKYETAATNTLIGMDAYMAGDKGKGNWTRNRDSFPEAVRRRIKDLAAKNGVEMSVPWGHMVGLAINPPVSDGERVYVSFGQGQTVCYDMTGKRLWAIRVALNRDTVNPGNLLLSPLLADDVLVDMHGGTVLRGLDKLTGKVMWEAQTQGDTPVKGGGYYVGCHRAMSLPGPDGAPVKIIVTTLCNIIRARDGKTLGTVPFEHKPSGGPTVLSVGDVVIKTSNGDGFTTPIAAYRLKFTDADHVVCERLWEKGSSPGYHAQVGVGKWTILGGSVYEVATGTVTYQNTDRSIGGYSQTLAGDRFLWSPDGSRRWGGRRPDGTVTHPVGVAIFSEGGLRLVTTRNVLGESVPARVPAMEKYAPELYAVPDYQGQSYGRPAHLMNTDCAIMPHGDRLYIRTVNRLYCIGPAVQGTVSDDPKVVAAIRGAKTMDEVVKYLESDSAQYRYEAVRKVSGFSVQVSAGEKKEGGADSEALTPMKLETDKASARPSDIPKPETRNLSTLIRRLALDDIYEEIRAVAVTALDAIDPVGKPGTAALQEAVTRTLASDKSDPCLTQTLVQLGTNRATAALLPLLSKDRTEADRAAAMRAIVDTGLCNPHIRAALLDLVQNDPSRKVVRLAGGALSAWPVDPGLAANLRDIVVKVRDDEAAAGLFRYAARNLLSADRTAFLMEIAKSNHRMRGEALRLVAEVRPPVDGLGDWMIERSKVGDRECIRLLGVALGTEPAALRLVEMLAVPAVVPEAAMALAALKKNEVQAAIVLAKYLPTVADNNMVNQTLGAMDHFLGHSDPAVRQALVPGLVALLRNDKVNPGLRKGAAERLGRLKQDAAPALDALRKAATDSDKALANAATAAIKAIEPAPVETKAK